MRFLRIFLLHFQIVLEQRGRSFVWFLLSLLQPLVFLLFWQGALPQGVSLEGWTIESMRSYYLLLIVAGAMLIAHIEYDIALLDIHEGRIVRVLLRPLGYVWFKFFEETPHRIIQGFFGICVLIAFSLFYPGTFFITEDFVKFPLIFLLWIAAYFVSFFFKFSIALFSFWLNDNWGLFQMTDVMILLFAGFTLPLDLIPWLPHAVMSLPFAYMIYYPVMALVGQLSPTEMWGVFAVQLFYIGVFVMTYTLLWHRGIKRFTGVGQ